MTEVYSGGAAVLCHLYELLSRGEWVQVKREAEKLMLLPDLDHYALGRIYRAGARACIKLGENHACMKVAELGLPYAVRAQDWDSVGFLRHDLGCAHIFLGNTSPAREQFEAYLMDLPRFGESRRLEGFVHYNLGLLYRQQREYALAVAAYRQAVHCFNDRGLVRDTADCHQNIAWLFLVQKKPNEARIHIDLAAALQEEQPDDFAAEQLTLWAYYRNELRDNHTAAQYLQPILDGLQPSTDEKKASAWWVAAKIRLDQGQREGAKEAVEQARVYALAAKASHLLNLCFDLAALMQMPLGEAAT